MKKNLKLFPLRAHLPSPLPSYSQDFTPPAEIGFRSVLYLVSHAGVLVKSKELEPKIAFHVI